MPEKFVSVVKSLHDGMEARVLDQGSFSATFNVSNGVKQGCVLTPTLFSIMFAMLIRDAFHDTDDAGIYLNYRTDGGIFNLRRLRAKTTVVSCCSPMTVPLWHIYTLEHIQKLMDCFANAAKRFGHTISLKKTEVMLQPRVPHHPNQTYL